MSFSEIVGHERVLQLLSRAIARGSLPPSLILAGPEGVGKRRVAIAVAKAFNCTIPVGERANQDGIMGQPIGEAASVTPANGDRVIPFDACGRCPACRRIEQGTHPDVLMIEPEESGSIKIGQVRQAIEQTAYRPFEGRRRVVIFEQADLIVAQGQTAMLKTLEEPPSGSVFLLVTSRPDSLLPTVQSRCPRVRFGTLSARQVTQALVKQGFSEPEASAVAPLSQGSVGRAAGINSTEVARARAAAQLVLEKLATASDPRARLAGAKELMGGEGASRVGQERRRLGMHLLALSSLLRELAVLATRAPEWSLVNPDLATELKELSGAYDSRRVTRAFGVVNRAMAALRGNVSPKLVADWTALNV
jgi:DNA polymerase III subunit delta'